MFLVFVLRRRCPTGEMVNSLGGELAAVAYVGGVGVGRPGRVAVVAHVTLVIGVEGEN